jgi:hypothetical protein
MKGNRTAIAVVVGIVLLAAAWWLFRRSTGAEAVDLTARFGDAVKQPDGALFSVTDVTLEGETRKAIAITPTIGTRLTWKVTVPDDAWLRLAIAIHPDAWEQEGDGVKFLVGVSDGRGFEELFTQHVHPFVRKGDRKWIPVMLDLSAYAGEEVELKLNTYCSLPGTPADERNDRALWGAPEIVVR